MRLKLALGGLALALAATVVLWLLLSPSSTDDSSRPSLASVAASSAPAPPSVPSALLTAELPASRGAQAIRGRVLGPAGSVAGAVVVAALDKGDDILSEMVCRSCHQPLLECSCANATEQLAELLSQRRGEAPPIARATSDSEGRFALEGLEDGGVFTLWADVPGKLVGVRRQVRSGAEGADIQLGPGTVLRGRTLTDGGKPVSGASVTAVFAAHARFFDAVSSPDGTFALGPVPPGTVTVIALAPRLLSGYRLLLDDESDVGDLELLAPRSLAGRVLKDGQPARGAVVHLESDLRRQDVTVGADGAFSFGHLAASEYTVSAQLGLLQARQGVDLTAAHERLDLLLVLGPGGEIAGTVRDASGKPVAEARVGATSGDTAAERRTAADGSYRLPALGPGSYLVAVSAEGYLVPDDREVELAAGATAKADFTLSPACPFKGVVVDEEGHPVENAMLEAHLVAPARAGGDEGGLPEEAARGASGSGLSGRDGAFSIDQVLPGRYQVTVEHRAFKNLSAEATAPTTAARFVLLRGAAVYGVVLDGDGEPAQGANVFATPPDRGGLPPGLDNLLGSKMAVADARGEFRIQGLDEGAQQLVALLTEAADEGFTPARKARATVEVRAPATGPVTLRVDKGLSISGSVVDKRGRPVPKVEVFASLEPAERPRPGSPEDLDGRFGLASSRADGTFEVKHLHPGTYRVTARSTYVEAPEAPLKARAGDANVLLVVDLGARARGRVVAESGEPLARFMINREDYQDPGGRFDLPLADAESATLIFEAEGYAATERRLAVRDGEDAELGDVVLVKGRAVTGRVLDARTRAPVVGALVDVGAADLLGRSDLRVAVENGAVATRADGSFTLPHVEPKAMGLFAQHDAYRLAERFLSAGETDVTLTMEAGATVRGTVTDASGKPAEAMVMAFGRQSVHAVTEGGRYELRALSPGRLTLTVHAMSGAKYAPQGVDVPDSGEVRVDFHEAAGGVHLVLQVPEAHYPLLVPGDAPPPQDMEQYVELATATTLPDRESDGYGYQHLQPGPYTLFLQHPLSRKSVQLARQAITVGAGPEQRLVVPRPDAYTTLSLKE